VVLVLNTIESAKVSQCFFNSGGHANMSKLQESVLPSSPSKPNWCLLLADCVAKVAGTSSSRQKMDNFGIRRGGFL